MSWERYRLVMERNAIKTDDMATEDAYFLATHMPFAQLEVYLGGRTSSKPILMTEEEVFDNLVYNPGNEHRMIIVRGDNGTGKSHLIRYLKAKLENSPSTVYNPDKEQLIFLRRLNNSVRGVFSQLIEQKVIKDAEMEEKIRKFVSSTDAKDETAFKNDILYAYIAAVSNDTSNESYRTVVCRDIASFLSDSRVREHLLRENGAITRCYNVITAPSNQVLKNITIFTEEDFLDEKGKTSIIRSVKKQGDPQAADFATTLLEDDIEITKLVKYLNKFTREVVQRCADISSESTKSMFEQLRKELKRQGKNLTLFIEDFTGFTGIDAELITVLSTEHGGDYADLCRVTAIIGITNDYYDQFRDNFKDRVTHQISVTEGSFGTREFLVQMAGRYLNAIYCDPDLLGEWERNGAHPEELPISGFNPPCPWETVKIGNQDATLYPFNSRALLNLYEGLTVKSPRSFLKDVIRDQLKEYFNGKTDSDDWDFPRNPKYTQMSKSEHSSAIDRLDYLSGRDKNRLKTVFAIWGDGSAIGIQEADGTIKFGGINKAFLDDIGLASFKGIGPIQDITTGIDVPALAVETRMSDVKPTSEKMELPTRRVVDKAEQEYLRFMNDISAWFASPNAPLQYHHDYRKMLQAFLCGDNRQCGAINWQDLGVPAYIAVERLSDLSTIYIEGQDNTPDQGKAIVYLDRSAESRDVLQALVKIRYAKGWEFAGSVYYQQRLITWLERSKDDIIRKVSAVTSSQKSLPVLKWCLALQYLRAMILGYEVNTQSPLKVVESLFVPFDKKDNSDRVTKEWNDLIQYVINKNAEFESALEMLRKASATTLGAIQYSRENSDKRFYRGDELLEATEQLMVCGWDIQSELPEDIPDKHLLYNHAALLKVLYPKIKAVMEAEQNMADQVIGELTEYIGELNQSNLISTINSIQDLFKAFNINGILGISALQSKFEKPPIETAEQILKDVAILTGSQGAPPVKQLSAYSGKALYWLNEFLENIKTISTRAEEEEEKALKELSKISTFDNQGDISKATLESLKTLYDELNGMEVYYGAAR